MNDAMRHRRLDLTVAIILHGEPAHIARTINSVIAQEYALGKLTILCLDDGTSPHARSELDAQHVWIVDLPPGSSISTAKNLALSLSPHEFVFFLDDHMYLEPLGLNYAMAIFENAPQIAGVCGYYRSAIDSDWNLLRDIKRHSIYGKSLARRPITLRDFTTFSTGIGIVRKSVFSDLAFPENDFPPNFGGEDVPALLTLLNKGYEFVYVPNLVGLHEHNLTFREFVTKLDVEVRGRFSVFYWASGSPDLVVPYLHGFLNVPIFFYVAAVFSTVCLLLGYPWFLLAPVAMLAVEVVGSFRCLFTPVQYSLRQRLLASCYVLASDLLTPLCWAQYLVSNYKRPYSRAGWSRNISMLRLFLGWELIKLGLYKTRTPHTNMSNRNRARSRLPNSNGMEDVVNDRTH